jgi:hypothetical protein
LFLRFRGLPQPSQKPFLNNRVRPRKRGRKTEL